MILGEQPLVPSGKTLLIGSVAAMLAIGCAAPTKKVNLRMPHEDASSFCADYVPPPEGVVIAQKCDQPGKPTIIYLPDQHPYKTPPFIPDETWTVALETQRELYSIVQDLLPYPGKVPRS